MRHLEGEAHQQYQVRQRPSRRGAAIRRGVSRRRILTLLARHHRLALTDQIADRYSRLLRKYSRRPLRPADALIAAAAWVTRLPLVTRNQKHYTFISEITLIDPVTLKRIARRR
ncbi:MAG: PIN domain-containing protein [Candidatus Methylomirabilales bacterium]